MLADSIIACLIMSAVDWRRGDYYCSLLVMSSEEFRVFYLVTESTDALLLKDFETGLWEASIAVRRFFTLSFICSRI